LPLDVTLWEGKHAVRVLLARPGQPGASKAFETVIEPGGQRTLTIKLPATGDPAVELR
jgi:hypothetical protein